MKLEVDLKKISQENYSECIDYIVSEIKEKEYIVNISQFGSVKFPGISDIDLLIVIKDNSNYDIVKTEIDTIVQKSPYSNICFWHEALVVKKEDLKYLNFFHTTEDLKKIYGESIVKDFTISSKVQIYKWNTFFYRLFLHFKNTKKISMRLFLLGINNLATCLKYNDSELSSEFKEEVNILRAAALTGKNIEEESMRLLNLGFEEIKRIEEKNNINKYKLRVLIKKRNIYIFVGTKLNFIDLKILKLYLYPLRYYDYYKEYQKEVREIVWTTDKYQNIKKRFTSPDFFGF